MPHLPTIIDYQGLPPDLRGDIQAAVTWLTARGFTLQDIPYRSRTIGDNLSQVPRNEKIKQALVEINYNFDDFNIGDFIKHVRQTGDKKIKVVPFDFSKSTSGLCIKCKDIYFIFFNKHRNAILCEHIIIHELAHIVLDHPMIRVSSVKKMENELQLHFRSYSAGSQYRESEEEIEAEEFSRQVLTLVAESRRSHFLLNSPNTTLFPPFNE